MPVPGDVRLLPVLDRGRVEAIDELPYGQVRGLGELLQPRSRCRSSHRSAS